MKKVKKRKEKNKGIKKNKDKVGKYKRKEEKWSNDTNHRVFASTATVVAHYRLSVPPLVRLSEAPILVVPVTILLVAILLRHPFADRSWPHLHARASHTRGRNNAGSVFFFVDTTSSTDDERTNERTNEQTKDRKIEYELVILCRNNRRDRNTKTRD